MTASVADAVIVGVGARTPTGLTALQATMSARADKTAVRESHMVDKAGDPIATSRLASIADNVFGIDRLLALAAPALAQALFPWLEAQERRSQIPPKIPAFIALPSASRPGFDPRVEAHFVNALAQRARAPIDARRSQLVLGCRGGGAIAFERAIAELAKGDCDAVVVGGADSYFDPDVLEHLDRELRLHGPATENGFIPGEGAGFVVLAPRRKAQAIYRFSQILSAASANEPHPYGSDEPSIGAGATLAVRRAVERAGGGERFIGWALSDVANERHRVDEWSYLSARNHRAFTPDLVHDQPLLSTGDLGAASAAVLVVMASVSFQAGCAKGSTALVVTSSDGPERGALIVATEVA